MAEEKIFESNLSAVNEADYVRVLRNGKSSIISKDKLLGMANIEEREQSALQKLDSATASAIAEIESEAPELRQEVAQLSSKVDDIEEKTIGGDIEDNLDLVSGGALYVPYGDRFFTGDGTTGMLKCNVEGYKYAVVSSGTIDKTAAATIFSSSDVFNKSTMLTYTYNTGQPNIAWTFTIELPSGAKTLCIPVYPKTYNASVLGINKKTGLKQRIDSLDNQINKYIEGKEVDIEISLGGAIYVPSTKTMFRGDSLSKVYRFSCEDIVSVKVKGHGADNGGTISFFSSDTSFEMDTLVSYIQPETADYYIETDVPEEAKVGVFYQYYSYAEDTYWVKGKTTNEPPLAEQLEENIKLTKELDNQINRGIPTKETDLKISQGGALRQENGNYFFGDNTTKMYIGSVEGCKKIKFGSKVYGNVIAATFFSSSSVFNDTTLIEAIFEKGQPSAEWVTTRIVPEGATVICIPYYGSQTPMLRSITDGVSSIVSDIEELKKGGTGIVDLPTIRLPRLDVKSDLLNVDGDNIFPLSESKNKIQVNFHFYDGKGVEFTDKGTIAYQGQSSLKDIKKGFTCAFEKKHKFKNWLSFDEFHLKGYYNDWLHVRDTSVNNLYEEMLNTKIIKQRPFCTFNDFATNDVDIVAETNRLCHTDDFKCELYINDNYWGLYSFRIKKDRGNYKLTKNNKKHIQLDPATNFNLNDSSFGWTKVEVRNPKITTDINGNPYNGDSPTEIPLGNTHDAIINFWNNLKSVTSSTTLDDLSSFMDIDSYVDFWLLADVSGNMDTGSRNTLYTTYDGIHWKWLPYDLNYTFGTHSGGDVGWKVSEIVFESANIGAERGYGVMGFGWSNFTNIVNSILSDKIKERYKNLRDAGIFSVKHIMELFTNITTEVGSSVYADDTKRWEEEGAGYNENNVVNSLERYYTWLVAHFSFLDSRYNYTE